MSFIIQGDFTNQSDITSYHLRGKVCDIIINAIIINQIYLTDILLVQMDELLDSLVSLIKNY